MWQESLFDVKATGKLTSIKTRDQLVDLKEETWNFVGNVDAVILNMLEKQTRKTLHKTPVLQLVKLELR